MDEQRKAIPSKERKASGYVIGLISGLLILLPVALAFLYVRAFGVSVVFYDAWEMIPVFNKWSSGTLRFSHLFDQFNEHRMFFPEGAMLLLGNITEYNNVAEMYLILACLLATLVILLFAFRANIRSSWLFLFVPVSLLVFSLRQYENMLWGLQIAFAFAQLFGVLALFLLYLVGRHNRFRKTAFVAALGSGTVASFSVLQGLFVWPVGLLQLLVGPLERSTKRVLVPIWGLVGLGEWIAYFAGYVKPPWSPSMFYAFAHPVVGIEYLLTSLGSSLFWQQSSAFVGGLLLVCLILASLFLIYRNRKLGEYSFWLSLLLYSLLIVAAITLGRSGYGVDQALTSRYTTFSILAVVSVYAILVKIAFERRSRTTTILLVAFSGLILLSAAVSYWQGVEEGRKTNISREKAALVLYTYETQPDQALAENLNPIFSAVRNRAPVLQELGYNVFSETQAPASLPPGLSDLSPVASPTLSSIVITGDGIRQEGRSLIVSKDASFIKVSGWAVDSNNESAAGGVHVDVDGELFPAFYGMDRQDIADSLGVPSYRYSGFERAIPVSEIGAGTHELSVVVLTSDKNGYYRPDPKITLKVE